MNIVVTGANKGLGLSLVKVFSDNGHQLAGGAYGGDDTVLLTDLAAAGNGKVTVIPMDVTDEASVQEAASKVSAIYGVVDVLISNAGVLMPGDRMATLMETNIDELRRSLGTNTVDSASTCNLGQIFIFPKSSANA